MKKIVPIFLFIMFTNYFVYAITPELQCVAYTPQSKITVIIDGLRNNEGIVKVGLFKSKEGFPDEPKKAFQVLKSKIHANKVKMIFTNIPPGNYAIGILHDENSNDKMDTNFFGIPQEGYGASNNAKGHFGSPSFDDAKFEFLKYELQLNIKVQY